MTSIWPFPSSEQTPRTVLPPPRPGNGTRLSVNHFGATVSAPAQGATFDHPWRPALSGAQLALQRGTIFSFGGEGVYVPKIRSGGELVPMTEARLQLNPDKVNDAGESWVALEVEPSDAGEIMADSRLEIIHTDTPISHARNVGRKPLVLILWRGERPLRAFALTHFNLAYARVLDVVGARHFFV